MPYLNPEEQRAPASPGPEQGLLHEVEHWQMLAQAKEAALTSPQVWNFSSGGGSIVAGPAAFGSGLAVAACDKRLYALDHSGRQRWAFAAEAPLLATPLATKDGLFFGSADGRFYALTPEGALRWTIGVKGPVFGAAAALDDLLFFGTKGGSVACVDTSGQKRWTFPTQGPVTCTPVLAGNVLVAGSWDHTVYGIDPSSGKELWRFKSNGIVANLAAANDLVVFGSYDRSCTAISEGKQVWRAFLGGPVFAAPAIVGNKTLIPALDKSLSCLEGSSLAWRWTTTDVLDSTPTVANRTIYIPGNDNALTALSLEGAVRWKLASKGPFLATKPLVLDDIIYASCYDCHLYAADAATGRLRWAFRTSSGHTSHIEVQSVAGPRPLSGPRFVSQELAERKEGEQTAGSGGYRPLAGSKDMGVYATTETEHPLSQYSGKAALEGPEDHHAPKKKKNYAEC